MSLCLRSIQEFNWGEANSFLHSLLGHCLCWLSTYFLASISVQTNVFHSSFSNWRKFWTVTMNSLYTFTFKRAHIHCVLCLIKFAWSSFHIWKVLTIIINVSHLLGLYVENIGLPGLGSRDRASSLHGVNRIYILESVSSSDYSKPVVTALLPQKDIFSPSEWSLWTSGWGSIWIRISSQK